MYVIDVLRIKMFIQLHHTYSAARWQTEISVRWVLLYTKSNRESTCILAM